MTWKGLKRWKTSSILESIERFSNDSNISPHLTLKGKKHIQQSLIEFKTELLRRFNHPNPKPYWFEHWSTYKRRGEF